MFKSGAVRIEKVPVENGKAKIVAEEEQSVTIHKVEEKKGNATDVKNQAPRERHLEYWMGSTYEAMESLVELCNTLETQFKHDLEIYGGLQNVRRIAIRMFDRMKPSVERYGEKKKYGKSVVDKLIKDVLPHQEGKGPYHDLVVLQGIFMYLTHLESHLVALTPASQALWDKDFVEAVQFSSEQVDRLKAWVKQHLAVKAPQTLIVPGRPMEKGKEVGEYSW